MQEYIRNTWTKIKKGIEIQTYCLRLNPFCYVEKKYYQYIPLENPRIKATIILVRDGYKSSETSVAEYALSS